MITLEQAVDAACRSFLRDGTVDLAELSISLAVSRATLYRVVGSRDRLLTSMLWRLADGCLDRARAHRSRDGIEGVLEVVRHFGRQILASRSLRGFISAEPQTATRLLASADGGVSQLAIDATTRLFREAGLTGRGASTNGGQAQPRLTEHPEQVAYMLVRIVESLCFARLAGTRPDLDLAEQTIRAMLVRACTPRQRNISRFIDAAIYLAWAAIPEALLTDSPLPIALNGA